MKTTQALWRFGLVVTCALILISAVGFSKDDGGKTWDDAVALVNQAIEAYNQARFSEAVALYDEALAIVRTLDEYHAEATILYNLALCYYSLFDYVRAISSYSQALAIHTDVDNRSGEVNCLNGLGNCYYSLSNYVQAIDYYKQALAIQREIGDRSGEADSLNNLGVCYHFLSDYTQATDYCKQALAIYVDIGDRHGEGATLGNLGNCYEGLSDYAQAIACYEQSLAIAQEIDDRAGEAKSLGNLGICCYCLADYSQAINYFKESLAIAQEIGARADEAASLVNLGACYDSLSDYPQAIDYYRRSLTECVEIGDRSGEAACLGNLGNSYKALSDYDRAIDYHTQALAVFVEIGDRSGEATCLNNLGTCYDSLFYYAQAIGCIEQSLAIYVDIGDRFGEALSLLFLGNRHRVLSEYSEAIQYYDEALSLSVELGSREIELKAQRGLGRTYLAIEQLETARTHYEEAIEILEFIRGTVDEEDLRQSYFDSMRALYEDYLELLLKMGENEDTVFAAEHLRARTFLDALYQSGLTPVDLQLSEAGINRASDLSLSVMDSETLEAAVVDAQRSLLTNEAVLEYMVGEDGIYLWILTNAQTLGPEFIPYEREQLMRDVVALRQQIEPQARDVEGEPELFFADPTDALGQLYEVLLQPALAQLDETTDTLIFVPSGPLWYVPFAALVLTDQPEIEMAGAGVATTHRPTYLIDRYTLAFLPSLASLPMLMEGDAASTGSYLALANPTLSEAQQTIVGPGYQHVILETACHAFAPYVGGSETDVYVQADAQEALAIRSSTGQRVLMYACHGDFNPSVPLDSRLLLSPGDQGAENLPDPVLLDGDYHASEVLLTDHTGVDLVVLAACETLLPTLREVEGALGLTLGPESDESLNCEQLELIVAGDEVVGLSRAFLSSGAHSVLGTLWQASPTAIERLLIALGAGSQDGLSWAEALRQAQQEVIANENYDDVWFWAPYQLIGRWR